MANIPIIRINNTDYNIKDAKARSDISSLTSALTLDNGMLEIEWFAGGLISGIGSNDNADQNSSRTNFISVHSGSELTVECNSQATIQIYEFVSNTTPTAESNTRTKRTVITEYPYALKLRNDTRYIRIEIDKVIESIPGVSIFDRECGFTYYFSGYMSSAYDWKIDEIAGQNGSVLTEWEHNGLVSGTGADYNNDTTACRCKFVKVNPGSKIKIYCEDNTIDIDVFEFASNETTTSETNVRLVRTRCIDYPKILTLTGSTNYIRLKASCILENRPNIYVVVIDNPTSENIEYKINYPLLNSSDIDISKGDESFYFNRDLFAKIKYSNGAWVSSTNTAANTVRFLTKSDIIICPESDYEIIIHLSNSSGVANGFMYALEWLRQPVFLKAGTYFFITIRRRDAEPIATDIVETAVSVTLSNLVDTIYDNDTFIKEKVEGNRTSYIKIDDTVASGFFITRSDTSGLIKKIINPYQKQYKGQYMGQLHDHSWSSSDPSQRSQLGAEQLFTKYKQMGYDFMAMTNYSYGDDLTPNPYPNDTDLIWFCNSYEQAISPTIDQNNQNTHVICLNAKNVYSSTTITNKTANEVIEDLLDDSVFVTLAHPMLYKTATNQTLYTAQQLLALTRRLKYVEIYSTFSKCEKEGEPYVNNPAYALDVLASDGRIIWGVAVSDSHQYGANFAYANYQGNIKVFAPVKTREAIWRSYVEGNYYCCEKTSCRLNKIVLDNNNLVIDIGDPGATTKFIGKNATTLATVSGKIATYNITGKETYVRAEVTMTNGGRIWTNPIYITDEIIQYPT